MMPCKAIVIDRSDERNREVVWTASRSCPDDPESPACRQSQSGAINKEA